MRRSSFIVLLPLLLLLLGGPRSCDGAEKSRFCIDNQSEDTWKITHIGAVDNYDWEGLRPDHEFKDLIIGKKSEECRELEPNPGAKGCPFSLKMERDNSDEWISFRILAKENNCGTPFAMEYSSDKPSVQVKYCDKKVTMEKKDHPAPPCEFDKTTCKIEWKKVGSQNNSYSDQPELITIDKEEGFVRGVTSADSKEQSELKTKEHSVKGGASITIEEMINLSLEYTQTESKTDGEKLTHTETSSLELTRATKRHHEFSVPARQYLAIEQAYLDCNCFAYAMPDFRGVTDDGKKIDVKPDAPAPAAPAPEEPKQDPAATTALPQYPFPTGACKSGELKQIGGDCAHHAECVNGAYQHKQNPQGKAVNAEGVLDDAYKVPGC